MYFYKIPISLHVTIIFWDLYEFNCKFWLNIIYWYWNRIKQCMYCTHVWYILRRLNGQQINHQIYRLILSDMICSPINLYSCSKEKSIKFSFSIWVPGIFLFFFLYKALLQKEINTVWKCPPPSSPRKCSQRHSDRTQVIPTGIVANASLFKETCLFSFKDECTVYTRL